MLDVCEGAAIHASTVTYEIWSGVLQESDAAKKEKEEKEKAIEEEKEEVKHEDNEWGGCLTRAFCFSMKVNVWVFDLLP